MADAPENEARGGLALRAYGRAVTLLCEAAMVLATVLVLADLALIGIAVLARYALNSPIVWSDELVALSLTAIVMLGAPRVLLDHGHIEVDIVSSGLKGRAQVLVRAWSSLAVLGVAALLIFNGWGTAMFQRMIGVVTEGRMEIPVWKLQLLLPLGGALLVPVVILHLWQAALAWSAPGGQARP